MSEEGFPVPVSNSVQVSKSSKKNISSLSRDEMNLAEFPLTVLSTRSDPNLKTLEFTDSIKGKNGEILERKWIITGADKFGLPTASDDEVLLGLLKLTVDEAIQDRKVYFTRYELLKTLKWTTEGHSYQRLQNALDRLSGVRIKASNAFYDNETKVHSTRNFGIIDSYEIRNGREDKVKNSYFTWSETLFKSFQVGFIKKIDLTFYLDLESAVSKRLYRYLDKHFWYRSRVSINLFTLAHEKIGVSRNYKYASSIKQVVDPALDELKKLGFISGYEYTGKGSNTELHISSSLQQARISSVSADKEKATAALFEKNENNGQNASNISIGNKNIGNIESSVVAQLVERGLRKQQIEKLLVGATEKDIERLTKIIYYYDSLLRAKSKLISRNPAGFLFRAIERPYDFNLPGEYAKNTQENEPKKEAYSFKQASKPTEQVNSFSDQRLETDYLTARRREIDAIKMQAEPRLIDGLRKEVENALNKLKGVVSPQRLQQAVEIGVEEKLASLFKVPTFEEWKGTIRS